MGYSEYANPFIGLITSTVFAVLLSIILAWLRLRSRSVWSSSLAHAGTNMVLATLSASLVLAAAFAVIAWAGYKLLRGYLWLVLEGYRRLLPFRAATR